jgi:Reverse transcriptase (RNA-dependent DNA polymerase)
MLQLLNQATANLSKKKFTLIIFCDLKKAFDTCDIDILLKKLHKVGVIGTELRWFHSYLSDRYQFVSIDDCISDLLQIMVGVPQGSILGPLLFLIYINDLPECTELLSKLFADDTAIINEDDNLDRLLLKTNLEFQKVCRYFRMNKLSLHPDKTKFLIISNSTTIWDAPASIFINNNNPGQNNASLIYKFKGSILKILYLQLNTLVFTLTLYCHSSITIVIYLLNYLKHYIIYVV